MRRTDIRPQGRQGLFTARHRRLAWAGFLLLAINAPVMAWANRDDSWLMPLAVAAMVGYALIIDDHLRHTAARKRAAADPSAGSPGGPAEVEMTSGGPSDMRMTRGRPSDDPGSVTADAAPDQRPER